MQDIYTILCNEIVGTCKKFLDLAKAIKYEKQTQR